MTRYTNQSFWVGASDLEAAGTFRWFYSGDQFSSDLWSSNPISGRHCVRFNENFLKFSAAECDDKNYFICEVGRLNRKIRLGICRDGRDQQSCKIFVSSVNFS